MQLVLFYYEYFLFLQNVDFFTNVAISFLARGSKKIKKYTQKVENFNEFKMEQKYLNALKTMKFIFGKRKCTFLIYSEAYFKCI